MNLVYEACWSTYEEHGSIEIFDDSGILYLRESGYSVMSDNLENLHLEIISLDYAIELIDIWETLMKEYNCE